MEWFVITEEEHLGPFEEDTLIEMYEKGEVTGESFIWQEGWEEALQFSAVFEDDGEEESVAPEESLEQSGGEELISGLDGDLTLSFDDEEEEEEGTEPEPVSTVIRDRDPNLPPDLPPIPTEDDIQQDLKKISQPIISKIDNEEIRLEEKIEGETVSPLNISPEKLTEGENEFDDEFDTEFADEEEDKAGKSKKKILVFILLLLVGFAGGGFWFFTQSPELIRPNLMSIKDFERLKETVNLGGSQNKFAFAISKDKKNIWIATNNSLKGNLLVSMKGIKNKLLGELVEIKGTGTLNNHLIELKNFKFIVGSRFIDGIYEVELKSASPLEVPLNRQYFHENNVNIKYKGKVLISSFNMKNFKKQLQRFLKKKFQNSKSYWQEIIQKYQTVKMITDQIRVGFETLFTKQAAPWDERIVNFEAQYRNKWGQFFTEFVKANEASYEKLAIKKFDDQQKVLASYNNLSNLAIRIGETAMIALEKLQGFDFNKNPKSEVEKLKINNSQEFVKIMEKCNEKVKELSE